MRCPARCARPFALLALALTPIAAGQTGPPNGMRPAEVRTDAIVGATVVPAPGRTLEGATIVIRDGVIVAVGSATDVAVPPAARIHDGEGLTVYAGLIDPALLVSAGDAPDGAGAHWNRHIHGEVSMAARPAPSAAARKEMRSLGFTAAAVFPSSGIWRGSGVVLAMADENEHALAYLDRAMMAAGFDRGGGYPGSLMGAIALMRQTLLDAQWHAECRRVWQAHPEGHEPPIRADALAALADVITGRQRVLVEVSDELNALRAAKIIDEFDLDAVLLGSGLEFRRLPELIGLDLPIITPLNFPDAPKIDSLDDAERLTLRELMTWEQAPTNPRRLASAQITIALTTHGLKKRSDFYPALTKAIRHGLAEELALAALTTVPANLLGLEDVLGTIEPGKVANLLLVEGDLFTDKPTIRDTWINGRRYEISREDPIKLAGRATFTTDTGLEADLTLDTAKKKVALLLPPEEEGGKETKLGAKSVLFERDRLSFMLDGEPFDAEGYVQLAGVVTEGGVLGHGRLPDGQRFAFQITGVHEVAEEEEAAPEEEAGVEEGAGEEAEAPDDGLTGRWDARLQDEEIPPEARSFELYLELAEDGSVSGSVQTPMFSADIEDGVFDAATGRLSFTVSAEEGAADVEATVAGESLTGEATMGEEAMAFAATRVERGREAVASAAGDEEEDEDFQMPPERLVFPLGAYGRPAMPRARTVLVTGATIWTCGPRGILENADMLVVDGTIRQVGRGVLERLPAEELALLEEKDALVIDGRGKHVTPGLIDCHSHTGISSGVNEMGQTITAEVRIADVIDPDDISWYRQLAGGLTTSHQFHGSANPIGGQDSVVKPRWGGGPGAFPIADAPPGIKFALGENVVRSPQRYPNTRMGVESVIRDSFAAAADYEKQWDRYLALGDDERDRTMPPRRDLELEALVEVLHGERLVHCHSYRQDEILMLIRVADDLGFTIGSFQHVLEGYKVAEAIAAHGAGASSFSDWWAYKVEVMDAIPYSGALMTDVGVVVSFNSDSDELARRLYNEAAKAVRYGGLEPAEALELVTINPAKQLGIDHRTGSLEVGKDADFAIFSSDPLSSFTRCEQTWIEGARYFDLEEDQIMRQAIQAERTRLIQKLLAKKHGTPPSAETDDEDDDQAPAATRPAEPGARERWMAEQVRLGRDPEAIMPGDCCNHFDRWQLDQTDHAESDR